MTGGKSRPKKDKGIKVTGGQIVKAGEILSRGFSTYKPGLNVRGRASLYALCAGKVYFSKNKTSHGKPRTFINIKPGSEPDKSPKLITKRFLENS